MAETDSNDKKAFLLTGIDKLFPKLESLRAKVDGFKTHLEATGLGKLDISGLFKGGRVITPFVDGIKSAAAFEGKLVDVSESAKNVDVPSVPSSAAQNMNVFSASMDKISGAVDAALLPAVGALVVGLEPLLTGVGALLDDNPALVQGIAAGAIAFSAIQTAVSGASQAIDVMNTLAKTSPIVLVAMGIAVAAGLIVANWKPVSAFFAGLWQEIAPVVIPMAEFFKTMFAFTPLGMIINHWGAVSQVLAAFWDVIKAAASLLFDALKVMFNWTPLGLVIANWAPISRFFAALWEGIKIVATPIVGFLRELFSWMPMNLIIANWGPITGLFAAIWDLLKALTVPVMDLLRNLFNWTPLGLIIANWGAISEVFAVIWEGIKTVALAGFGVLSGVFMWSPLGQIIEQWEPITEWFSQWWDKLQAIMAPIKEMLGGDFGGFIAKITGKVEGLTEAQHKTNAEVKGEFAPALFGASTDQPALTTGLPQSSSALVQQSAANNRTQLEGGLTVRFENAPAGMRTDQPQTNQPGLTLTPRVGYRSLSLGGSNELA
ncbi:phage tail protein [Pseudomonas purpurea]|uniref:phage tail protein n=1 Tax=Pseudomonas purpurea TaxID=3136737 RepID=UPI0032645FBF